MIELIGYRRRL